MRSTQLLTLDMQPHPWAWLVVLMSGCRSQVGKGAPEDYLEFLSSLANMHDSQLKLDELRAYHFGQRYLVELEVRA